MKYIKFIYKFICFSLIIGIVMMFNKSSITVEVKSSNINSNKNINLSAMAKVINNFRKEDINIPLDTYYGDLTGYAADCPLCSGKLGCTGQNVLDGTTTYSDKTYGTIRIVASSSNLACGSIVKFNLPQLQEEPITAIVLDRGVTGTALDLLVGSEREAYDYIGRRRISYEVLRFGWSRENI